jgi:hypothetical protein
MTTRANLIKSIIITSFLGIILGFAIGVVLLKPKVSSKWIVLTQPVYDTSVPKGNSVNVDGHISVGYSSLVIFDSDIPPLKVRSLSGKAKFISHASTTDGLFPLGYIIQVSTETLDKSKIPDKYKKEKIIEEKAGSVTIPPLEQATYEVRFILRLLDHDGFELLKVNSAEHNITSGQTIEIQAQTAPVITRQIAASTDRITMYMVVNECLSATAE